MKRVILGPDGDGKNVILHEGAPHEVSIGGDPEVADAADEAGEKMSYAWAAAEPLTSTEDLVAGIDPINFRLRPGETRFMRVEIAPGGSTGMHQTPYITDYLVALAGELTMYVEDGSSTVIGPGDMLVQLGGMHRWSNEGPETFVMAGVVVGVRNDDVDVPGGVVFGTDEES
jgi:quercetin dioxygenase-like cupin family protein